ncbi:MAG: hypothetical protein LBQ23_01675, partial [Puniceicoccales bacterium]|nr:hypothetical protein [Puniceicoccales bacterium]
MFKNVNMLSAKEIYLNSGGYEFKNPSNDYSIKLPAGRLLISGSKTSFSPQGKEMVYAYEANERGRILRYYINNKPVSESFFDLRVTENLPGSNFGKDSLYGVKSLLDRKSSRFLTIADRAEGEKSPKQQKLKTEMQLESDPMKDASGKLVVPKISGQMENLDSSKKLSGCGNSQKATEFEIRSFNNIKPFGLNFDDFQKKITPEPIIFADNTD